MPKPIRTITLAAGALILILSLISASTFWPMLSKLDWSFYRALLIAGSPLIYILIAVVTNRTLCYWIALALLKAETSQWLLAECFGKFLATYREMYPVRERQVRNAIGGEDDRHIIRPEQWRIK